MTILVCLAVLAGACVSLRRAFVEGRTRSRIRLLIDHRYEQLR